MTEITTLSAQANTDLGHAADVIRRVYKQVFGNKHLMELDVNESLEALFMNGDLNVQGLVTALAQSDTYKRLFLEPNSPYRFVELNFKHLLGRPPHDQAELMEHVRLFAEEGYEAEITSYTYSEEYLAAFGLTEPNAGSDTAAIETTARLAGDHYVLNGTKTFITSGASADYFIVMAKLIGEASQDATDSGAAKRGGNITAFIVEKDYPGFSIGQKFDMLGMRGYSTCEIVFSDCQVPSHNLLGQHGEGRKVALSSLAKGRVTIAAQAVGWAQGALDALLIELQRHYRDGDLTLANELNGMAVKLGDLAVKVEAARALMYQAARFVDAGESNVSVAGMAKTMATDTAMLVAGQAIDMLGSDGLKNELLLERIFRDAKAGQIYEGTNQIQRMLIARDLLK